MKLTELFPGQIGLSTDQMAKVLNLRPQTLRKWASNQRGPITPIKVAGRLFWPLDEGQRLVERDGANT